VSRPRRSGLSLLAGMALVSGCGSASHTSPVPLPASTSTPGAPAQSSAVASATPHSQTSAPGALPLSPPTAPSTSAPSSPHRDTRGSIRFCQPAQVNLSLINSRQSKNDNAVRTDLQLRNVSPSSCEVRGYPGVSFTDRKGAAIGPPAERRTGGQTGLIGVGRGQAALAEIDTLPESGSGCAKPTYVVIYLPNSTAALRVTNSVPLYYCQASRATDPQAPSAFAINAFRAAD